MLITTTITPISVIADSQIAFTGTIMTIQGQRLEILLTDGKKIWGTMTKPVPENIVGDKISGGYSSLGDTYVLINPIINNKP